MKIRFLHFKAAFATTETRCNYIKSKLECWIITAIPLKKQGE